MMSQVTDKSNQSIFHMWLTTLKFDIDKYYLIYSRTQAYVVSKPPIYSKLSNITQHANFIFSLDILPRMYVFFNAKIPFRCRSKSIASLSLSIFSKKLSPSLSYPQHNTHSVRQNKWQCFTDISLYTKEICKRTFYQYELVIIFPLNSSSTYYVPDTILSTGNQ